MKVFRIIRQAFKAIGRNKGRSFLTSLGIIIGIASVITLLAIGQGAQNSITARISNLGTTTLTIRSGAGGFGFGGASSNNRSGTGETRGFGGGSSATKSTLTQADLNDLRGNQAALQINKIAGYVSSTETLTLAAKDANGNAQQQDFAIIGTEPDYFDIQKLMLASGRELTSSDVASSAKSLVIGSDVGAQLFAEANPIGKTTVLNNQTYTIVGVLAAKEESGFSNPNKLIYGPLSSITSTYSLDNISTFYTAAINESSVDAAKAAIENKLQTDHGKTTTTRDFNVTSQKDLLTTVSNATDTFKILLTGIASISLVVGGIGIMNIMFVAVTERTREIGLRKAVGAKTRDILLQFLCEAIFLCLIGGIIGVAAGAGVSQSFGHIRGLGFGGRGGGGTGFTASVTPGSIILAVTVSFVVGLVFGTYPAIKASRLNPIDALRYE